MSVLLALKKIELLAGQAIRELEEVVPDTNYELREDGAIELREDGSTELREA